MSTVETTPKRELPLGDRPTDVRVVASEVYLLPVVTRVPLKFGSETLTSVTCVRVRLTVRDREGRLFEGWGETPLSIQWIWPSPLPYQERFDAAVSFVDELNTAWSRFEAWGHALEVGHAFQHLSLESVRAQFNADRPAGGELPHLAALVCCSAFDLALHDAYGNAQGRPVYETYNADFLSHDLFSYLEPADGVSVDFAGMYPQDYFVPQRADRMPAWHLVGGLDPLEKADLDGSEPSDGYPVLLADWIERDGLGCLKVKLRGNDSHWDFERLVRVATIGQRAGVEWLCADFNCTVTDPLYVNDILDRLAAENPEVFGMLLFLEQPFPYDMKANRIVVNSVSQRKPLLMDESADDWQHVKLGHSLGWTGVAFKTCKTQTGTLLSLCWAKAHGMHLMVHDLTNPMLAQIPHVLLAAHAGTMMGVETNAMQFYPEASSPEAEVHPGIYARRNGQIDLSTIRGTGFGYRVDEIQRELPASSFRSEAE
ncbi:MAG: mandelate racemase/muconate lactonizing enzyme family protein [Planctomycetota bacterium]